MSGRTLATSIRIDASPEAVWNLITTLATIADWYDDWDVVEPATDDQNLHVGLSFRLTRRQGGRVDTALCRVTAVEEPQRVSWLELNPNRPTMAVEFRLVPGEDPSRTGTVLHHTKTRVEPDARWGPHATTSLTAPTTRPT
jgi:uncharacterized protein YndB with AHSA1/START domain